MGRIKFARPSYILSGSRYAWQKAILVVVMRNTVICCTFLLIKNKYNKKTYHSHRIHVGCGQDIHLNIRNNKKHDLKSIFDLWYYIIRDYTVVGKEYILLVNCVFIDFFLFMKTNSMLLLNNSNVLRLLLQNKFKLTRL